MKKLFTLLFVLMLAVVSVFAQAPQKMSYQAVVRNANNTLLANQNVSARISILQGSVNGAAVYVETHAATTNANGLLTLEVGDGNAILGTLSSVNWGDGPFYLKSEIDPDGGVNYSIEGVQQLMSVPYALYAGSAGNVPAFAIAPTDTGYVLTITINGVPQTYVLRNGRDGVNGADGDDGADGLSAYELWQQAGNTGTLADFLASLVGPAGQDGEDGDDGFSPTITQTPIANGYQIIVTDVDGTDTFYVYNGTSGSGSGGGADGLSAYELWLQAGNTGTLADFLASLVGPAGQDGEDGEDGEDGNDGFSPTITQTATTNGYQIIVTDVNGTDTFYVNHGAPGVSPTITASAVSGGTQLTITDVTGTHSYLIPSGGGSGSGGTLVQLPANWNETNAESPQYIMNKPDLADVATSGDYADLINKPTIPTTTSQLTNNSGFITASDIPAQQNADWTATSGVQQILHKPDLATVATSGSYNDLSNKPTIPTTTSQLTNNSGFITASDIPAQQNADWTATSGVQQILHKPDLAPVATSGSYTDLTNKPTIPAPQVNADWTATSGVAQILNKPTALSQFVNDMGFLTELPDSIGGGINTETDPLFTAWNLNYNLLNNKPNLATVATSGSYTDLINTPTLATVATTGSYNDLLNKPDIPAAQVNADWTATSGVAQILHKPTLAAVATSGSYNDLLNKPDLADVATSGDYADLVNKPTIPTTTSQLTNNSGFITAADVPAQVNADWTATSGVQQILHKPNLAPVATSGSYNDLTNKPTIPAAQVNADWNATSGLAQILNKPTIPEYQVLSISHDTLFLTNGGYVKLNVDWGNVANKPAFATVAYSNDYNDLTNAPSNLSDFANDEGFITAADIPAATQADWDETDNTEPSYIQNKPDLSNYLTSADMSNYVDRTTYQTVGGDKTFTGYTTFDGSWADFYADAEFYNYAVFDGGVDFLGDISVSNSDASIKVPNALQSISGDGTFEVESNSGNTSKLQAVNYNALQTVYNDMLDKFSDLNDQIEDLLDSIEDLNKQLEIPKDGEPCPNSPTVTDYGGNIYSTVRIGNQCWMRQNMRATNLSSGSVSTTSTPYYSSTSAYATYSDLSTSTQNLTQYGRLYNYKAASQICPPGWKLPSSADWAELRTYVKSVPKFNQTYYSKSLAFTESWEGSTIGDNSNLNNTTGFSAVAAGYYPISMDNQFWYDDGQGYVAAFWSSDKKPMALLWDSQSMHIGGYSSSDAGINSFVAPDSVYFSVRCIRKGNNGENLTIELPTVETNAYSSTNFTNVTVTSGSVSLTIFPGNVTSNANHPPLSNLTQWGFVYSSSASNSTTLQLGKSNVIPKSSSVSTQPTSYPYAIPSFSVTGLTSGNTYYYRAFVIRGNDTVYGAVKSFVAQSDPNSCKAKLNSSYPEHVSYDGYSYSTVAVGNQCWLAQNLRNTSGISSSNYYYIGSISGNVYNWDGSMLGTASTTLPVQGICPSGWHIPTTAEFDELKTYVQGQTAYQCSSSSNIAKALAYTSGWTSSTVTCAPGNTQSTNNATGFAAYPGGYNNGSLSSNGKITRFRTTTMSTLYSVEYDKAALQVGSNFGSTIKYSVRCIYGGAAPTVATSSNTVTTTFTSASNLGGNVINNGGNSITERGICYSYSTETPTISNNKKVSSGTTGTFTVELTGLSNGTTYYYRAYATNSKGTTYGAVKSFTTKKYAMIYNNSVSGSTSNTGSVTALQKNSARVWGNVQCNDDVVTGWGFYLYKKNSDGTFSQVADLYTGYLTNGTYTGVLNSTPQNAPYSMTITGLEAGATYKYSAEILRSSTNSWIEASEYSNEFTTLVGPSVTTTSVMFTGTTSKQYTFKGNLVNKGVVSSSTNVKTGFVWSRSDQTPYTTSPTLRSGQHYDSYMVSSNASLGSFSCAKTLAGAAGTIYRIRAYAINEVDTSYGAVYTITLNDVPTIALTSFDDPYYYSSYVKTNQITAQSYISSDGGYQIYETGWVYSTTNSTPTTSGSGCAKVVCSSSVYNTNGNLITNPNTYLTNLSPNTSYYLRPYAMNAAGISYGATKTVKTAIDCNLSNRTLTDQNGNTYLTVKIDHQCWMKANLKATTYDNNSQTAITLRTGGVASSETTPYRYYPGGSSSNVANYGYLYNWPAATGYGVSATGSAGTNMTNLQGKNQGVCPRGWHIPTNAEFATLDANINNYFGSFALQWAGGVSSSGINFNFNSNVVYFWSTTTSSGDHYHYYYNNNTHSSGTSTTPAAASFSVRCIQDISY